MFTKLFGKDNEAEIEGIWTFTLTDEHGNIKTHFTGKNLVTTAGKEFLASFLQSAAVAASTFTCKYIAVGTNNTAANIADTVLGTESARQTGTASYLAGAIYQVTATFAAGVATTAIVEYGLLSSSAAGTLLGHDIEAVINKGAGDTLTVTAAYTFT